MSNYDFASDPDFYTHLITGLCFFFILLVSLIQTLRLLSRNQFNKNRGAIHLCIAAASAMGVMDSISRMAYNVLYGDQLVMCYYPYVLTWYFIFTAYILALEMWIVVYNRVSKGAASFLRRLRITFAILDAALLAILVTVATLWPVATNLPDYLYVGALAVSAVGISALFSLYGAKIARRLGAGLKMQIGSRSASRDQHLYTITVQIVMLSVTCFSGAILALIAKFVQQFVIAAVFSDVVKITQSLFEMVMMIEMFYMVKPKPVGEGSSMTHSSSREPALKTFE